jgi:glycine dehydrogenase subunit 2
MSTLREKPTLTDEVKTLFDKSHEGERAYSLPKTDPEWETLKPDAKYLRKETLQLPEISELNLIRHFTELAERNFSVDQGFYPLGSCTMKYNPRICEKIAAIPLFQEAHPLSEADLVQGHLEVIWELQEALKAITGYEAASLAPAAGAQGELFGLKIAARYMKDRGEIRDEVLVADSAHGTNPASSSMMGCQVIFIKSGSDGDLDLEDLEKKVSSKTLALMLTNPSTLGLFSKKILAIRDIVKKKGALLYYDGANLNALMTFVKIKEMGFDITHLNLHKTFSTPHGGGGPGGAALLVSDFLEEYLPPPRIIKEKDRFVIAETSVKSVGPLTQFHGHFAVSLRALVYMRLLGEKGLRRVSEMAVLNANYLRKKLAPLFFDPYPDSYCMHEFVLSCKNLEKSGVGALDVAKRILDYGFHAPSIYFPTIVEESMLIEPTECESKETLDRFAETMKEICREVKEDPEFVKRAPHTLFVKRIDEVMANRQIKATENYN